jgi:N-acetylneuraminate synthase
MRLGVTATIDDADEMSKLELDFLELLVREGDRIVDIERFLSSFWGELILHAPERIIFEGRERLLDLASIESGFREICRKRMTEISELTEELGIPLVVHPGGVLPKRIKRTHPLVDNLIQSLEALEGIIWVENMPRRYHSDDQLLWCNILLEPKEIKTVTKVVDGVVLDVSHAYLSVTHGGNALIARLLEELGGRVSHLHLSDARYPDIEGLQLGDGDIDFSFLRHLGDVPILLEVWHGHENGGEGFGKARRKVKEIISPQRAEIRPRARSSVRP